MMPSFAESATSDLNLPVIDVSQLPQELGKYAVNDVAQHPGVITLREACTDWGFFSVVNHGIPQNLLENVERVARELFSMPNEAKDRVTTSNPKDSYFRYDFYESFCILDLPNALSSVQDMSRKIWPEQEDPNFCEIIGQYASCLADLARTVIKSILVSLGLPVESSYKSYFENCAGYLRINHNFPDGKPEEQEVPSSHTDVGCITILYQDNCGGLQIRSKEGEWFDVKPQPNSLIINIADSLKVWSNGRYRSADHRVVSKGAMDRISLAFHWHFPEETPVSVPAELVDDEHPQRYKSFLLSEYKKARRSNRNDEERATMIERSAGM